MPALRGQGNADDPATQYTVTGYTHQATYNDWQKALIAAERHGRRLTWGDGFRVLYVILMAVLGVVGAIVILGV